MFNQNNVKKMLSVPWSAYKSDELNLDQTANTFTFKNDKVEASGDAIVDERKT